MKEKMEAKLRDIARRRQAKIARRSLQLFLLICILKHNLRFDLNKRLGTT